MNTADIKAVLAGKKNLSIYCVIHSFGDDGRGGSAYRLQFSGKCSFDRVQSEDNRFVIDEFPICYWNIDYDMSPDRLPESLEGHNDQGYHIFLTSSQDSYEKKLETLTV